jgi:hypothetical protein
MQARTFCPYLVAIDRIVILLILGFRVLVGLKLREGILMGLTNARSPGRKVPLTGQTDCQQAVLHP